MSAVFLHKAFLIPFIISMSATALILWYRQVHNPIRQFRPPFGQQFLIGIVLTMISAGISWLISMAILSGTDVMNEYKADKERKSYDGSGSTTGFGEDEGGDERRRFGDGEKSEAEDSRSGGGGLLRGKQEK